MIHVLATIQVRPGTRDQFLLAFAALKPHVLVEAGCVEYGAAVDLDSGLEGQPPCRPDTVVIVEQWASLEALNLHLAAPHMAVYRANVKDIVTGVTLQILEPVG